MTVTSTTARPLAATLISISILGAAAQPTRAGHYYEADTRIGAGGRNQRTAVRAWVDGERARIDLVSGDQQGFFVAGNYLVTTDGGENVYLIDPKAETWARFDLDDMMANLGRALSTMEQMGGMVKMEVTDTEAELVLEQPGEPVLGHATTHYRYRTGYTMNLAVMGMKQTSRNDSVTDIWTTDDLVAPGFAVWLRPDRQMKTGHQGLDEMLGQQFGRVQGLPLRMVMETTATDKKGRAETAKTTMEVTVLREEPVTDDRFTWPDHYTETEILPDLEQGIQTQLKDVKKKQKEAAAQGKKQQQDAKQENGKQKKDNKSDQKKGLFRVLLDGVG